MKKTRPASRAAQNWRAVQELPHTILDAAVDHLSNDPAWRRRLARAGVTSIGYGQRAVGTGQVHLRELCLVLGVKKKWKRPPKKGEKRARILLPRSIELSLKVGGRRRRFAIPIDVQERRIPVTASEFIDARTNGDGRTIKGVACALVREAGRERPLYLLSCLHVLAGAAWRPYRPIDVNVRVSRHNASDPLAQSITPAYFTPTFGFDAAIARVDPEDEGLVQDAAFWNGPVPETIATNDAEIESLYRFAVWTPRRATPVFVRFRSVEKDQMLVAPSGDVYRVSRVIRVEFESSADPTLPGDSGSAVMAGSLLAGMHIAGDPPRTRAGDPSPRYAYFIPAYALFYPKIAFDQDLQFAR